MGLRARRWGMGLGVVTVGLAAYAALASSEGPDRAGVAPTVVTRATPRTPPETSVGGLIARLPFVGTLTWRCEAERRFATMLTLPRPGATVHVSVESDGTFIWRRRRVDPADPRRTVVGPFPAARAQVWTIRYHHKPATLTASARLRFAATPSRSQCIISRTSIRVRRTAH